MNLQGRESLTNQEPTMQKTCVLIANAQRARYYERQLPDHTLTELADFVHPVSTVTQRTHQLHTNHTTEEIGKGHGRTAHAGTQFEPHTETKDKERRSFARTLADYVNTEVTEKHCTSLVLIATAPMLGDMQPLLSYETLKIMRKKIEKDLLQFNGVELIHHIDNAIE